MVDVILPDGSSMYVPQGAAADTATYVAFNSEAQAEVNKYWLPAAETAAFGAFGATIAAIVPDLSYARAMVCALAMCGATSTPGGITKVIEIEGKIVREITTRRRIERIASPGKVTGDPP